ncbi:MAG: hypothetical protein ACI4NE_03750 [Succinivibrio sp.]
MLYDKYQQRSMLLLLPLGLLAIVSFALDKRIPIGIDFTVQSILLKLCRTMIPGFFAIAVACMIPTINRFYQLLAVGINYVALSTVSLTFFPYLFSQPTAWVVASLTASLFLLPSNDLESEVEGLSFGSLLRKSLGVIVTPTLTLAIFVVLIKNIEHSILITFTSIFIDSILSCLFVPIYEIMLTLGFSSILNNLVNLQTETQTVNAILNSILLTNLIALPTVIVVRSIFSNSYNRLFLVFLAIITTMTSKIGSCISVELAILMFFYPGTLIVLCLCSIACFFICVNLQMPSFTNFYMLYQPDLTLKNLIFLQITTVHYIAIALCFIIAVLLQMIFSKIGMIYHIKDKFKFKSRTAGLKIKQIKSPSLMIIAILKNIGGKSNLRKITKFSDDLYLQVFDLKKVSSQQLLALGKKNVGFLRNNNEIRLTLGSLTFDVALGLENIIRDSADYTGAEFRISQPFNIKSYMQEIKEKSRSERQRLDTNQT